MLDIKIKVDAKQVLDMLDKIDSPQLREKAAESVADQVVLPALAEGKYPKASGRTRKDVYGTAFKTDKQRRFFFAALASGAISIPYQRSGDTGTSYQKRPIPDGISVYSDKPSAGYTRGDGNNPQVAYFRGVWDTHEELAKQLEGDAALAATAAIIEELGA